MYKRRKRKIIEIRMKLKGIKMKIYKLSIKKKCNM